MSLETQLAELATVTRSLEMTIRVLIENQKVNGYAGSLPVAPANVSPTNGSPAPAVADAITPASTAPASTAPAGEKKGPGRPKKEVAPTPTPGPAAAQPDAPTEDSFDFGSDEAPARTYTIEEIRNGLKALSQANKPSAIAILSKRGYKGVGEIREADYAGVAAEIEAGGVKV